LPREQNRTKKKRLGLVSCHLSKLACPRPSDLLQNWGSRVSISDNSPAGLAGRTNGRTGMPEPKERVGWMRLHAGWREERLIWVGRG
jgi:hypothetical protein